MMHNFWNQHYLRNSLLDWTAAGLTFVAIVLLMRLCKHFIISRLRHRVDHTDTLLDDVVLDMARRTSGLFSVAMGILGASTTLHLPGSLAGKLHTAVILMSIVQAGLWGGGLVQFLIVGFFDRRAEPGDVSYGTGKSMLKFFGMALVWSAVLLMLLENVGINVSTLVAGLGVGGVAVAFATQNILSDLIASVSILLDKPFLVGDFIICDTYNGTIEKIGIRTTRLRSLSGEAIILANSDLSKSRVRNFKTLKERRIVFGFGIRYETPPQDVAAVSGMVAEVIQAEPQARFDRAHLLTLGESGLQFEVSYYVRVPEYVAYCDMQQRIILELMRRLQARGIGFAYRTQVNYTYNYAGNQLTPPAPGAALPAS